MINKELLHFLRIIDLLPMQEQVRLLTCKVMRRNNLKSYETALDVLGNVLGWEWCADARPEMVKQAIVKYMDTKGAAYAAKQPKPVSQKKSKQKPQNKKANRSLKRKVCSDAFLKSYEWRKLRMEAIKLYGNVCQCCGASPKTGAVINVDHIQPRRHRPDLALDIRNLQILCHECNHGKGNWDKTDWRYV